jgi:hypothetical protein
MQADMTTPTQIERLTERLNAAIDHEVELAQDNRRLRSALTDMIEITKRNSSPEIILTAICTCAAHALDDAAAQVGEDYNIDDAPEATVVRLATIERCAQVAERMGNLSVSRKDTICREIAAAIRELNNA